MQETIWDGLHSFMLAKKDKKMLSNYYWTIEYHSDPKIELNARTDSGRTVFMMACSQGNKDVVVFMLACMYGNIDVVQLLLSNSDVGIELNLRDNGGWTLDSK